MSDVYLYNDCDAIFLLADLNSRIGSLDDISDFNDINIPRRNVIDKTANQHGQAFVEFLNEAKMCVLNGRFDVDDDSFTNISSRGRAVVDYICVPHENFDQCVNFKVMTSRSIIDKGNLTQLLGERSKVPDHSALIVEFQSLNVLSKHDDVTSNWTTGGKKWFKLKSIPNDFMSSDLSRLALQTMISRIDSARETQGEVDSVYENLCKVITTEKENSIPIFDTSKGSRKRFKSTEPFWNDELKNLWNIMHAKEK